MNAPDGQHKCASQDTERSPKSTIDHIPDEVLLEIFDSYRQCTDYLWKQNHMWLILAHVCRKWRAIMFASSSRLDLCITVGPKKPGHIKTILSGHLPILIDYECLYGHTSGSALWRMRAALKHQDRVREIAFRGSNAWFDEFFKATKCSFPVLESLDLDLDFVDYNELKIPDTFLRGPDLSDLNLRRLKLNHVPLTSISGFLLSATALTDLSLTIDTTPSPEMSLLFSCLQGMPCLRSLRLCLTMTLYHPFESQSHWPPSAPKDVIPLPKLTRFRYDGRSTTLDALVAGISAPSLRDVDILPVDDDIQLPLVHLPRFLNEIKERYHTAQVIFNPWHFRLSLLAPSEYFGHRDSLFNLNSAWCSPDSLMRISDAFSMRLTTVEELHVTVYKTADKNLKRFSWRRFFEQFPSVKVLRTGSENNPGIAHTLHQNYGVSDGLSLLPALEEIYLSEKSQTFGQRQRESRLATFQPFISARRRAGRPVKVFFDP